MVKKEDRKLTVVKNNHLIEAAYSLTLVEQKAILLCISKIDSLKQLTTCDTGIIITADEIDNLFTQGKRNFNGRKQLNSLNESLYERSINFPIGDTNVKMRWIHQVKFNQKEGTLELFFTTDVLKFLTGVRKNFTPYKLHEIALFTSHYGVRIYEMMLRWKDFGHKEVEIEWLKERLELQDKYARIKDFKKYVIEQAMNDINKHSNYDIAIIAQRTQGRKVTHITFSFTKKDANRAVPYEGDLIKKVREGLENDKRVFIQSLTTDKKIEVDKKSLETLPTAYAIGEDEGYQLHQLFVGGGFKIEVM